jgi:hypothetical protein
MTSLPEHLAGFIDNANWIFAKTYANTWPHEYIVSSKANQALFVEFAVFIRENGYLAPFYSKEYTYFDYENLTYWTMDEVVEETTIINRCSEENTYPYRLAHGNLP